MQVREALVVLRRIPFSQELQKEVEFNRGKPDPLRENHYMLQNPMFWFWRFSLVVEGFSGKLKALGLVLSSGGRGELK